MQFFLLSIDHSMIVGHSTTICTVSTPTAVGYVQKESVELFVICTEVLTKPKDEYETIPHTE